jgi:hypothetical protein
MSTKVLITAALLFASAMALAAMSECETDCENVYKACATSGKMSERACRVERENCRKACLKKLPASN